MGTHSNEDERIVKIQRYANLYVSSDGYIISKRMKKPRIYKQHLNNGMPVIRMTMDDGSVMNLWPHKEVAKAFVPNPNKYKHVIHKDFDNENNKASNLEWVESIVSLRSRVLANKERWQIEARIDEIEKFIHSSDLAGISNFNGNGLSGAKRRITELKEQLEQLNA